MPEPVRVVHVVAKTHLDLGFTALAAEVEARYREDFFPRAAAVGAELEARGGPERLTWTTGSWILHRALQADPSLGDAVEAGHLAWHAYPFTTHTELLDAPLVRSALAISQELDARFGRPPTNAAKMTDVPGHTRGLVPFLAEAGVTFLHIGVNPAWPVPDVPPLFRWGSPDGTEVTVAYQAGGYGGEVVVEGCGEALAFLHTGDNLGPPSADDVIEAHAALRRRFPGAEVRASTLDAFARALAGSGAVAALPVVTAEIGDPWIFGCASDPQKLAAFGWCRRSWHAAHRAPQPPEVEAELDRALLCVAEHTWGLDEKVAMPADAPWDRASLPALRATDAVRRYQASWAEQRELLRAARRTSSAAGRAGAHTPALPPHHLVLDDPPGRLWPGPRSLDELMQGAPKGGWRPFRPGSGPIVTDLVVVDIDQATGAVNHLVDRTAGRIVADPDHLLGLLTYQAFDESDYRWFLAGLDVRPEDEWWAVRDNTKPGADGGGAVSDRWAPEVRGAWWYVSSTDHSVVIKAHVGFPGPASQRLGAPPEAWLSWTVLPARGSVHLEVLWLDKPASRLPEAMWCSFVPRVAEPDRWTMDKLGQAVSPLDVVRRGGRSLHGVGDDGVRYDGPDGALRLRTPDAPLVAPGAPNLLDADPHLPDMAGGWHVLLHDNCWGTNFPMWSEGPASFGFTLDRG